MYNTKLYFHSGELFANGYERVVHGERGSFIELTKEQIVCKLKSKFGNDVTDLPNEFTTKLYYFWLVPESGTEEKIYLQLKKVWYADYKRGYYYISPSLIKDFQMAY